MSNDRKALLSLQFAEIIAIALLLIALTNGSYASVYPLVTRVMILSLVGAYGWTWWAIGRNP